jgi:hypothetical protein
MIPLEKKIQPGKSIVNTECLDSAKTPKSAENIPAAKVAKPSACGWR